MKNKIHIYILLATLVATLIVGVMALNNRNLTAEIRRTDSSYAQTVQISEQRYNPSMTVNINGSSITRQSFWLGTNTNAQNSFLAMIFDSVVLPTADNIQEVRLEFTATQNSSTAIGGTQYLLTSDQIQGLTPSNVTTLNNYLRNGVAFSESGGWTQGSKYSLSPITSLAKNYAGQQRPYYLVIKGDPNLVSARRSVAKPVLVVKQSSVVASTPSPTPYRTPNPTVSQTLPPTKSPTPVPTTQATMTPVPNSGGVSGTNSMAMGKWTPSQFDTCTQAQHDAYYVIGPDGKKYPTWHPATGPGGCKFGHEHGRDPRGYANFAELQRHYGRDVNGDGQINDLDNAGIPFGYVNEQIALVAGGVMRHEDHVGNKIEYANTENDRGEEGNVDSIESGSTPGVIVPIKTNSNPKWVASGIRCQHFHKFHQGVTTGDAFGNNLHELLIQAKCTSTRSDYPPINAIVSGMVPFGAAGEFTRFCGEDRNQIIKVGLTDSNYNWPGITGVGMRNITTRDCIVNDKEIAGNYEIWSGDLRLTRPNGQVVIGFGGSWEVLDSVRYYYPGQPNNVGYMADICSEPVVGSDRRRGNACDPHTDYGRRVVAWNDPRSAFRGLHRGQYVDIPTTLENAGGANVLYTDWNGRNASTTPFTGSIKQIVPPVSARATFAKDPRIVQRWHNDYNGTVHAPN